MAYRNQKREREGKKEEEAWENVSGALMVYGEETESEKGESVWEWRV